MDLRNIKTNVRITSFDVFDTVITRKTASPVGVFMLMQHKLLQNRSIDLPYLVHNFPMVRMQAEETARQSSKKEEVTISQIYEALSNQFDFSPNIQQSLIDMEIDEEDNASVAIPYTLHLIDRFRDQGIQIIFTSDTYLPKNHIQKMLEKAHAFKAGDNLYVSNEFLATKASGNLFKKIVSSEQCQARHILHVGDNLQSDVIAARRVGLQAFLLQLTKLNRYEIALLDGATDLPFRQYIWQCLAGTARNARLSISETGTREELFRLGANVAGPVFLSYALWVLKQAETRKITRLYFISRDGQILLELSRRIAKQLNLNIDMRYLYGSRQAWFLPAITELKNSELDMLLQADPTLSIRILSNRICLNPDFVKKQINSFYGKTWNIDDELSDFNIQQLRQLLLQPVLQEMLLARAKEARSNAIDYFHQEGLFDEVSWGLVDLGWRGRLQDSLQHILRAGGRDKRLYGFYFGLFPKGSQLCIDNEKLVFIKSAKVLDTVLNNYTGLLEIFAAADHGTTLYYHKAQGRLCPVLKEEGNEQASIWGLTGLRNGIFKFLEDLPIDVLQELYLDSNTYQSRAALCMKLLKFNPFFEEAEAIGNFMFSSDQAETYMKAFALPAGFSEALDYIINSIHADYRKRVKLTNWVEATCVRSSSLPKFMLHYYILGARWLVPKMIKNLPPR